MLYRGKFKSNNNTSYTVNIITNKDSKQTKDIELSNNPVTIEYDSDGLFSAVKSRSCTVEIFTSEIFYDMYTASAQDVTVEVKRDNDNKVIFSGYLTPCIYSQDYNYKSKIKLEAVDKLSSLEYFEYSLDDFSQGYQNLSLMTLIKMILKKAGYNTCFYYPKNSLLQSVSNTDCILDYIHCGEANFFDDDDDHTAWKLNEMLDEICNFLGVSAVPYYDEVWFVDYQCVNKYQTYLNSYDKIPLTAGQTTAIVTPSSISIDKSLFKSGGVPSLSLDDVFNKITVSCSVYEYDDTTEGDTDIYGEGNSKLDNFITWGYFTYYDYVTQNTTIYTKDKDVRYTSYIKFYRPSTASNWKVRCFESNNVKGYLNDVATKYLPPSVSKKVEYTDSQDISWCYSNIWSNNYGAVGDYEGYCESDYMNDKNEMFYIAGAVRKCLFKNVPIIASYSVVSRDNVPVSNSWQKCLMYTPINRNFADAVRKYWMQSQNISLNEWTKNGSYYSLSTVDINPPSDLTVDNIAEWNVQPSLEYNDSTDKIYYAKGKTTYITIKFQTMYIQDHEYRDGSTLYKTRVWFNHNNEMTNTFFPVDELGYTQHLYKSRDNTSSEFNKGWKGMKFVVSCGGKYWNGTTWTTTPSTFIVNVHKSKADKDANEELTLYEWQDIVYNTSYIDAIGEEVYAIPITESDSIAGKLHITVYSPYMNTIDDAVKHTTSKVSQYDPRVRHTVSVDYSKMPQHIFVKDLKINFVKPDKDYTDDADKDEDTDIIYTNIINDKYVQDFDDLELKINTYCTDKPLSYSYINNGNGEHITDVYAPATQSSHRPEEHLIEKYYNHYCEPKKILDMSMLMTDDMSPASPIIYDSISDKVMMIDSQEIDLQADKTKIKLIEY